MKKMMSEKEMGGMMRKPSKKSKIMDMKCPGGCEMGGKMKGMGKK